MRQYDCVVIGAGNGGLGAATALALQGMKPLVIERHNLPGGCASSFVRGRFEFDTALHIMNYDMYKPVWHDIVGLTEKFDTIPQGMLWTVTAEDGSIRRFEVPIGLDKLAAAFDVYSPGSRKGAEELFDVCREVSAAMLELGSVTDMQAFCAKYPHFAEFSRYTLDQGFDALGTPKDVRDVFNSIWWYIGPSPDTVSFLMFCSVITGTFAADSCFPEHCSHGFNAEFESIIRKHGGDIWFNTAVTKINVENGRVCGVETDRGDKIATGRVITNLSPDVIFGRLIPEAGAAEDNMKKYYEGFTENESFFVVYLGLDASPAELGIKNHHIFVSDSADGVETYRASYTLDGPYTIGALCHNVTVRDFSPEGTCVLSISAPMHGSALDGLSQKDYVRAKYDVARRLIETTERHLGIELTPYIEEIEIATPATLARYNGHPNGALGYEEGTSLAGMAKKMTADSRSGIGGLYATGQFINMIGYHNSLFGFQLGSEVAASIREGR